MTKRQIINTVLSHQPIRVGEALFSPKGDGYVNRETKEVVQADALVKIMCRQRNEITRYGTH